MGKINLKFKYKCKKCGNMLGVFEEKTERCFSCGEEITIKKVKHNSEVNRIINDRWYKRIIY
jgi:rRNA maturation endonuclease Nob1